MLKIILPKKLNENSVLDFEAEDENYVLCDNQINSMGVRLIMKKFKDKYFVLENASKYWVELLQCITVPFDWHISSYYLMYNCKTCNKFEKRVVTFDNYMNQKCECGCQMETTELLEEEIELIGNYKNMRVEE